MQVKTGPRRLDRLHAGSGHNMFTVKARQSFAGTRRRTAMWLIAAWLAFSVFQVFAACCTPVAGSVLASTQTVAAPKHQEEATADDCCHTADQPCQMVLDGAPPAAPATGLFVPGRIQHLLDPPVQLALRFPDVPLADGPARVPIPQGPPDPIYLRLQRFLI